MPPGLLNKGVVIIDKARLPLRPYAYSFHCHRRACFCVHEREQAGTFHERKLREIIDRLRIEIIGVNADIARKYAIVCTALE